MIEWYTDRRMGTATATGPRFSQRDVLVVAVIVLVITPVLIAVIRAYRDDARRAHCADNLKQIGFALLLYSNENRGFPPRVRYEVAEVVTPVWGTGATSSDPFTGPEPNDVTAAMFLLLRTQDFTAQTFVCPGTDAVPDTFGDKTVKDRATFTDWRKNLSYSMQNPYPEKWAVLPSKLLGSISTEFAVAADMNPGTAGDEDDVTKPNATSSAAVMRRANSNNHGGDGQNVLYSDGHVEFHVTPFAGYRGSSAGPRDNIFTSQLGAVVASPRREYEDSILLPTDD
jgi:prepilin-type processing-associated H-X9-DG protein